MVFDNANLGGRFRIVIEHIDIGQTSMPSPGVRLSSRKERLSEVTETVESRTSMEDFDEW